MAKHHDSITADLAEFILRQPMFFVATAAQDGRVNVSPKGLDNSFKILDPHRVAFLNLTGSGNETAAHLRSNNRITLMLCSFDTKPLILRLYGTGTAIHHRDAAWADLDALFPDYPAKRQIVEIQVTDIITSCGYGVPMMDLVKQRTMLPDWAERKGEDGIRQYWQDKNSVSFDGQPTGILS
jgi:predicted pyridoxine 5'-phosphate oxidase superfamily flavin-nucleotide-binding protein